MSKRYLPTVVIVIAVILLLLWAAGRINGPDAPTDGLFLRIDSRLWSQPHERQFVQREIIEPFEREHGCRVDLQVFSDERLLQRAEVQHATGIIATDVVIAYVSRMPQWVERGYVADLSGHPSLWEGREFAPGFAEMTTFDGARPFLPIGADDYLLCAAREALEYLPDGADPQDITWEQLVEWARNAAEAEGQGRFAVTGAAQTMLIYQVAAAVLSYGGGFPDVASGEALEAWEVLAGLKDALAPTVRTFSSVVPPMKRGEAWLAVAHNARVGEVYASNPTGFIIAPAPRGPAGRGSVAGVSGLGIMEGAPNEDLAVKFLEYITRPDTQVKLSKGAGGFIPTVLESVEMLGEAVEDEVIQKSMQVLEEGRLAYIPPVADWETVKLVYDEAFEKIVLRDGRVDVDYLRQAQARIDAVNP